MKRFLRFLFAGVIFRIVIPVTLAVFVFMGILNVVGTLRAQQIEREAYAAQQPVYAATASAIEQADSESNLGEQWVSAGGWDTIEQFATNTPRPDPAFATNTPGAPDSPQATPARRKWSPVRRLPQSSPAPPNRCRPSCFWANHRPVSPNRPPYRPLSPSSTGAAQTSSTFC